MNRPTMLPAALATTVLLACALPSAAEAQTAQTCTSQAPALRFQVDRNSTGKDRQRRAISLRNAGGTTATAVKPIRFTIVRGGKSRTVEFSSLNDEYRYRARPGERVSFLAVYAEDSSGYGKSTVDPPVALPVDLTGVAGTVVQTVFGLVPTPVIQVLVPSASAPGMFGSAMCARVQGLVVKEKAARRGCLARRSPIGPNNIGRIQLGLTRAALLERVPAPRRRTARSVRFCVKGGKGTVSAVFSKSGRVALVTSTSPRYGNRSVFPGSRTAALRSAFSRSRNVTRTLIRANRTSPRLFGVRGSKVRFVAVATRGTIANRAALRAYLRYAGV